MPAPLQEMSLRVRSIVALGKFFIDLDQTKKDKRLDHLMIFRMPAPGKDSALHLCRAPQILRQRAIGQRLR